jgi:hypothetical protein
MANRLFDLVVRAGNVAIGVGVVAALAVALSVVQMLQYWVGMVAFQNTTWEQYWALFVRFHR